jgi:shikimate dehydrogenase
VADRGASANTAATAERDAHSGVGSATVIAGVIGCPIRHSRSPAIVNAAFRSAGLDWAFAAFEVAEGRGAAAVEAMRVLGLGGLSVTMPHKHDVIAALDRLDPAAAALEAVNCIAREGDELVGYNTDGPGLVASLRAEGIDPAGKRCGLLGAGGAARSVAWALGEAGAAEVAVVNRTRATAEVAAQLAGRVGRVAEPPELADTDLLVNATSVGMGVPRGAVAPLPLDATLLRADQVVIDLVYVPRQTPLLRAAAEAGARPIDGLGMLVHQAALAVLRWTGQEPDLAAMDAAART